MFAAPKVSTLKSDNTLGNIAVDTVCLHLVFRPWLQIHEAIALAFSYSPVSQIKEKSFQMSKGIFQHGVKMQILMLMLTLFRNILTLIAVISGGVLCVQHNSECENFNALCYGWVLIKNINYREFSLDLFSFFFNCIRPEYSWYSIEKGCLI